MLLVLLVKEHEWAWEVVRIGERREFDEEGSFRRRWAGGVERRVWMVVPVERGWGEAAKVG